MAYCVSAPFWASKQRRGEYGVRRKAASAGGEAHGSIPNAGISDGAGDGSLLHRIAAILFQNPMRHVRRPLSHVSFERRMIHTWKKDLLFITVYPKRRLALFWRV